MKNFEANDVLIYYIQIPLNFNTSSFYHMCKILPDYFLKKSNKFRFERDKLCYLFGKFMLQYFLIEYKEDIAQLKFNEFGKPFLDHFFDFNLSHSEDKIVFSVVNEGKIGIDLEELRDINLDIFNNFLSKTEIEYIHASENKIWEFYNIWTKKEALLKSYGSGISNNLDRIDVLKKKVTYKEESWFFTKIDIFSKCITNICTNNEIKNIKIIDFKNLL